MSVQDEWKEKFAERREDLTEEEKEVSQSGTESRHTSAGGSSGSRTIKEIQVTTTAQTVTQAPEQINQDVIKQRVAERQAQKVAQEQDTARKRALILTVAQKEIEASPKFEGLRAHRLAEEKAQLSDTSEVTTATLAGGRITATGAIYPFKVDRVSKFELGARFPYGSTQKVDIKQLQESQKQVNVKDLELQIKPLAPDVQPTSKFQRIEGRLRIVKDALKEYSKPFISSYQELTTAKIDKRTEQGGGLKGFVNMWADLGGQYGKQAPTARALGTTLLVAGTVYTFAPAVYTAMTYPPVLFAELETYKFATSGEYPTIEGATKTVIQVGLIELSGFAIQKSVKAYKTYTFNKKMNAFENSLKSEQFVYRTQDGVTQQTLQRHVITESGKQLPQFTDKPFTPKKPITTRQTAQFSKTQLPPPSDPKNILTYNNNPVVKEAYIMNNKGQYFFIKGEVGIGQKSLSDFSFKTTNNINVPLSDMAKFKNLFKGKIFSSDPVSTLIYGASQIARNLPPAPELITITGKGTVFGLELALKPKLIVIADTKEETERKSVLISDTRIEGKLKDRYKLTLAPFTIQPPKEEIILKEEVIPKQKQENRAKIALTTITEQELDTVTRADIITDITPIETPPEVTTRPRGFFLPDTEKKRKPSADDTLYKVKVKERGKFVQKGRALPSNRAFNEGAKYVDENDATTFKLIQAKKKGKGKDDPNRFRTEKFYKRGNTYIEKNKYRIDSAGERAQIPEKGLLSLSLKRRFF